MTNYENITGMAVFELAEYLSNILSCRNCIAHEFCQGQDRFVTCTETLEEWLVQEEDA